MQKYLIITGLLWLTAFCLVVWAILNGAIQPY